MNQAQRLLSNALAGEEGKSYSFVDLIYHKPEGLFAFVEEDAAGNTIPRMSQ
jgi:hypothetical protein